MKPTTGGGVVFGLSCADIAARVAVEAIRKNDFSSAFLQKYQEACQELIGFDFSVMTRIRRLIDSLSDEKLDATLRFCHRIGLNKAFQNVEDIDFQGQTLLKIIKKPSAIAALAYFLRLFFTANN